MKNSENSKVVGEEVVKRSNDIKALPEGAGENGSLKSKENFELSPHRRQLLHLSSVYQGDRA